MSNKIKTTLIDDVVDLVERRPGASFPEIQRVLDKSGHDVTGDVVYGMEGNLIFWAGLSDGLAGALMDAEESKRIHMHLLHTTTEASIVYSADGVVPDLAIAIRPPAKGYKEPHWVPVVFYIGGKCSANNCAGREP
jgi:hypothetical protein